MNFKGGIIIVGSLIWDTKPIRHKWRQVAFIDANNPIYIPIKIRYGRQSQKRQYNYTMIFSNHSSTQVGQAFILEFESPIKNFSALQTQAYALAQAEGICKILAEPTLNCDWGTVGLLFNPELEKKDSASKKVIQTRWTELYQNYQSTFHPSQYIVDKDETPVIDKDGLLSIEWNDKMNEFDLLLATPTKPKPLTLTTPKEIAEKIKETGNDEYFIKNKKHNIFTFQDAEILNFLNA